MENNPTSPAPVDQRCWAEYDKLKQELKYALDVLSDCAGQFFLDDDGCLIADLEKRLFALLVKHKRVERVSGGSFRMLPNTKIGGNPPIGTGKGDDHATQAIP